MKSFSDCVKLGRWISVLGLFSSGVPLAKAPDCYFKKFGDAIAPGDTLDNKPRK